MNTYTSNTDIIIVKYLSHYLVNPNDVGFFEGFTDGYETRRLGEKPRYKPTMHDWMHLSRKNRVYFIGYIRGYGFDYFY